MLRGIKNIAKNTGNGYDGKSYFNLLKANVNALIPGTEGEGLTGTKFWTTARSYIMLTGCLYDLGVIKNLYNCTCSFKV